MWLTRGPRDERAPRLSGHGPPAGLSLMMRAGPRGPEAGAERDARRLHVVHMTAEMAPAAKVGGLGDVVTGLARACLRRGHRVEVAPPPAPHPGPGPAPPGMRTLSIRAGPRR